MARAASGEWRGQPAVRAKARAASGEGEGEGSQR